MILSNFKGYLGIGKIGNPIPRSSKSSFHHGSSSRNLKTICFIPAQPAQPLQSFLSLGSRRYTSLPSKENLIFFDPKCLNEFQELLQALEDESSAINKTTNLSPTLANEEVTKKLMENRVMAKPKLDMVIKMELIENETVDNISKIWKTYHQSKFCISSVIETSKFMPLYEAVSKLPMYVIPLIRSNGGIEFFYFEQRENIWLFTELHQIQNNPSKATPALKVAYYFDLTEKEIVLMRGEIDPTILTIVESQFLVNQTQTSYLEPKRLNNVVLFNRDPENFDWHNFLPELGISSNEGKTPATNVNTPESKLIKNLDIPKST